MPGLRLRAGRLEAYTFSGLLALGEGLERRYEEAEHVAGNFAANIFLSVGVRVGGGGAVAVFQQVVAEAFGKFSDNRFGGHTAFFDGGDGRGEGLDAELGTDGGAGVGFDGVGRAVFRSGADKPFDGFLSSSDLLLEDVQNLVHGYYLSDLASSANGRSVPLGRARGRVSLVRIVRLPGSVIVCSLGVFRPLLLAGGNSGYLVFKVPEVLTPLLNSVYCTLAGK